MTEKTENTIAFHYLKGPDFRTLHVDGAIGGWTPMGFLHVALFSERPSIPTKIVHAVAADGRLGDEIESRRETKDGLVRQMEVDIFLSEVSARQLRDWLDQKLAEMSLLKLPADSKSN